MGFGWQEIDKTLDLCYIRVAGLHRECKPAVLFDPPNFRPRTMTHIRIYVRTWEYLYSNTVFGLQLCCRFTKSLHVVQNDEEFGDA